MKKIHDDRIKDKTRNFCSKYTLVLPGCPVAPLGPGVQGFHDRQDCRLNQGTSFTLGPGIARTTGFPGFPFGPRGPGGPVQPCAPANPLAPRIQGFRDFQKALVDQ